MTDLHLISIEDQADFQQLEAEARRDVMKRLKVMRAIAGFDGTRSAAYAWGEKNFGIKKKTLERLFSKSSGGTDWRPLLNRSRFKKSSGGLPLAFVEFWKSYIQKHQRSQTILQSHRALDRRLQRWENGDATAAIPGYPRPPQRARGGMPRGWSYKNLSRSQYVPSKASRTAIQVGPAKLAEFLPSNYKTRVGLAPAQFIFFDDQWYDVDVADPINAKPMRPLGFNALDYLSGCHVDHVIKTHRWDLETQTRKQLTGRDFVWFVLKCLSHSVGYRRDKIGSTYVFEHGTASGGTAFDDAIARVTGGQVRIERSGMFGDPLFAGMMFSGARKGNPRFKAPIESSFNLVRNEMAALPGATGINRDRAPEERYGLERYYKAIHKLTTKLPPHIGAMLQTPYLTSTEFGQFAFEVYNRINQRNDHNLEGWMKAGHFQKLIRPTRDSQAFIPCEEILNLPGPARADYLAAGKDPDCRKIRPLSPAEVWTAGRSSLAKVPVESWPSMLMEIDQRPLCPDFAHAKKVNQKHEIILAGEHGEKDIYIARMVLPSGDTVQLQPGREVLVFQNPLFPDRAPVTDHAGRIIGVIELWTRPQADDTDAILRNNGKIQSVRADIIEDVQRRSMTETERRAAIHTLNQSILRTEKETKARSKETDRIAALRAELEGADE